MPNHELHLRKTTLVKSGTSDFYDLFLTRTEYDGQWLFGVHVKPTGKKSPSGTFSEAGAFLVLGLEKCLRCSFVMGPCYSWLLLEKEAALENQKRHLDDAERAFIQVEQRFSQAVRLVMRAADAARECHLNLCRLEV